ncbi:BREX system Lon protease-like protein BrxL [Prevotella cerevisiae]|uniref:BREX system Lon protease-like protein BrxL n=1 Tax=Segatella cerevisiae TaxID=2053716 RepID=A0ABT1BVP5_9BACT|nr:BREX system Lon protease-like protein BrxL [Segatella cerevisiae]MCO6024880.1 BREX system Lon protease-like protein BrxL [Segatella cerevisiae]
MTLQEKIMDAFLGKVVRKDLAFQVKSGLPVPTYVLEYLLGQYCASDDEEVIKDGLEKVKTVIQNNYVHRADAERVKGIIRENGHYRVIDKVTATLSEKEDEYHAAFANLGLTRVPIGTEYILKNPKLLSGNGVWCIVTLGYNHGEDLKVRWEVQSLKPIQISHVDKDEYVEQRKKFTTDEWMDLLLHTLGLNPDILNRREKLIILARLLPHVENNFNFMELGPKGTGKSHVFQELSPYGVLVSGGDVTSARLFVKMSGNKEILGLVGYWDVVAWDEFEQQKGRSVDAVLIDTMQNYLANKSFNRGKATHEASASMVFVGNTKHTVPFMMRNSHLFESIPTSFIKGAFLDRIHLYNPGWEVKMLKKASFSKGYGLITDYIAAVLHALRNTDCSNIMDDYAKFDGSLSERDHLAIRKTFSGMMKLLYPDGNMTDEEAYELVDFAAEGRKRVKDQLYKIDETFLAEPAIFKYVNLKSGETVSVKTLEEVENPTLSGQTVKPVTEGQSAEAPESSAPEDVRKAPRPRIPILREGMRAIRMNQKGITYKSLLGDYLCTAHKIKIVDPYVRAPFQIDNLLELIQTVREVSDTPEELSIHLSTANEEDKIPESEEAFTSIANDLQPLGIEFTFDFKADHDRWIILDNGWKIQLSRGLDVFEKPDRYSLAAIRQAERRCRAFTISFVKDESVNFKSGDRDSTLSLSPKKEDCLYLTISQKYFDQIIAGTKKVEYREIKDTTAGRFLERNADKTPAMDSAVTEPGKIYYLDDYNNGHFPFLPKRFKYLDLAVGYHKERDSAVVEVTDITFSPEMVKDNNFCIWVEEFHLGKIVNLYRKTENDRHCASEAETDDGQNGIV